MVFSGEQFEVNSEQIDLPTPPTQQRYLGDGVGSKAVAMLVTTAGRGDGFCSRESNPALALDSRLKVRHPCLRSWTSDLQQ